jgi:hypothetical protein
MTTGASENQRGDFRLLLPVPLFGWRPPLIRFAFNLLGALEELCKQEGHPIKCGAENIRHILRDPPVFYGYDIELIPIPLPRV